MTKMLLTLAFVVFLPLSSLGASQVKLSEVTSKRIGSDFFIELAFTGDVSDKNVETNFADKSIEFTIPHVALNSAKKILAVRDSVIERSFILRTSDGGAKYKLQLKEPYTGLLFQKNTILENQGNRLLIRIGEPAASAESVLSQELRDNFPGATQNPSDNAAPVTKTAAAAGAAATASTAVVGSTNEATQPVFKSAQPEAKDKGPTGMNLWGRLLVSLLLIAGMAGGAVVYVKKTPGGKKLGARNRMIEILSQHPLGPKRTLAVVRVAGEAVLIGVTDNNISILKTLSLLDDDVPTQKTPPAFEATFASKMDPQAAQQDPEDEFSMKGLRDIVNERLKNMRSLN